jgi:hypothetical protein
MGLSFNLASLGGKAANYQAQRLEYKTLLLELHGALDLTIRR